MSLAVVRILALHVSHDLLDPWVELFFELGQEIAHPRSDLGLFLRWVRYGAISSYVYLLEKSRLLCLRQCHSAPQSGVVSDSIS